MAAVMVKQTTERIPLVFLFDVDAVLYAGLLGLRIYVVVQNALVVSEIYKHMLLNIQCESKTNFTLRNFCDFFWTAEKF